MPVQKAPKKHYLLKSQGPRRRDITKEERSIMDAHVAYWTEKMDAGIVLAFGPVHDPSGAYGVAIVEVDDENQVQALIADDPAVKVSLLRTESYPMLAVLPKK